VCLIADVAIQVESTGHENNILFSLLTMLAFFILHLTVGAILTWYQNVRD